VLTKGKDIKPIEKYAENSGRYHDSFKRNGDLASGVSAGLH
jgi:hypothetical protein